MRTLYGLALVALVGAGPASAEIRTATEEYQCGDTTCEGWFAYDDAFKGRRPAVLIIHQWKG